MPFQRMPGPSSLANWLPKYCFQLHILQQPRSEMGLHSHIELKTAVTSVREGGMTTAGDNSCGYLILIWLFVGVIFVLGK